MFERFQIFFEVAADLRHERLSDLWNLDRKFVQSFKAHLANDNVGNALGLETTVLVRLEVLDKAEAVAVLEQVLLLVFEIIVLNSFPELMLPCLSS